MAREEGEKNEGKKIKFLKAMKRELIPRTVRIAIDPSIFFVSLSPCVVRRSTINESGLCANTQEFFKVDRPLSFAVVSSNACLQHYKETMDL